MFSRWRLLCSILSYLTRICVDGRCRSWASWRPDGDFIADGLIRFASAVSEICMIHGSVLGSRMVLRDMCWRITTRQLTKRFHEVREYSRSATLLIERVSYRFESLNALAPSLYEILDNESLKM
jgi:hypothetical protein